MKKEKIITQALKHLKRKEHSQYDLRYKLVTSFPEANTEDVNEVIQICQERGWLSDQRFTQAFVHDQWLQKIGPNLIKQKLTKHKIDHELTRTTIDDFVEDNFTEILEHLESLANKKIGDYRRKNNKIKNIVLEQKIWQFLYGRGFTKELIEAVDLKSLIANKQNTTAS